MLKIARVLLFTIDFNILYILLIIYEKNVLMRLMSCVLRLTSHALGN